MRSGWGIIAFFILAIIMLAALYVILNRFVF